MKKAQAAMEFLMTYGWAILVVLIAIGALSYFGVLNPSRFLPDKCTFTAGVSCGDFSVILVGNPGSDTNILNMRFQNNLGEAVILAEVDGFVITDIDSGLVTTLPLPVPDPFGIRTWEEGSILNLPIAGFLGPTTRSIGQRYRIRIDIRYTGSSGLEHTATGEITGRVGTP